MLVQAKTLNKMFKGDKGREQINCDGKCFGCGGDIKISVSRTAGGYGLSQLDDVDRLFYIFDTDGFSVLFHNEIG